LFQTTTTYPSLEWLQESLHIFRQEVEAVKSVKGLNPQIITYPIPSRAIRGMDERGGNALGLSGVQGPLLSMLPSAETARINACINEITVTFLSTAWVRAQDDIAVGAFYDRVLERLEAASTRLNVNHPYKYVGYGRVDEDIFASYGAENREKLVRIQESVDPRGIFTRTGLCRGGFKIR
jgi:hypothetical protein